jgi:acetyl-CoA carboxylase biotin carboxyl carrier protein
VQKPDITTVNVKQHPGALKSPMVGTLYVAPEPGSPPFAKVGSRVNQGDTVFIIEAMKVMNPIKAHATGIVKEVFFNDATPVEYGDLLMIIE